MLTRREALPIAPRLAAPFVSSACVRKCITATLRGVGTPFVVPPLAMPIVIASSSCVWSAIALFSLANVTVVHIAGSRAVHRALGIFFPHTVGSSTRIGMCPVVIGAPTVRLAKIVGAGCVALAAAAAITMRLCGRAAASAGPPPAVGAQHWNSKRYGGNPVAENKSAILNTTRQARLGLLSRKIGPQSRGAQPRRSRTTPMLMHA